MTGSLLLRGMLAGLVAGLLCFAFLKFVGEPAVDRSIAFETQMDDARDQARAQKAAADGMVMPKADAEPELVSRPVQAGIGLFTGVAVYGASVGGLFGLAFALVNGRLGRIGARATSALLAGAAFVAIDLVPSLKYAANPPSVGDPDTIGMRTGLYFAMVALSLAAMIGAVLLHRRLVARFGAWDAALMAAAAFIAAVVVAGVALPTISEVPEQFPAVVLWQFRTASLGAHVIMWTTIGLLFGSLTVRRALPSRGLRLRSSAI